MAIELDKVDKKLLYYLSGNARLSYSVLASNVGLSREAVKNRIERMVREKAILSFRMQATHPHFGLEFYNLYISFSRMDAQTQKQYEDYIKGHPAVMWGNRCLGRWDYTMFLLVKDLNDLAEIISDFKDEFRGNIRQLEFDAVLYEYVYRSRVGKFFEGLGAKEIRIAKDDSSFYRLLETKTAKLEKKHTRFALDKTDVKILEMLSENCRQTLHEMAVISGIPVENIRYRMRRLIENGGIVAFWATINYDVFGLHWYRIMIKMNRISEEEEKKLTAFLVGHPNVFWAPKSIGIVDMHIDIRAEDNKAVNEFLTEFNSKFGDAVIDYETLIMTNEFDHNNFTSKMYEVAKDS